MGTAVVHMEILPDHRILLCFVNGSTATVDMSHRLTSLRFAALASDRLFQTGRLCQDTLIWQNGETEVKVSVNELLDSMQMI